MRFDDTNPEKEKVDFEKVGVGCCTRVCVCVCVCVMILLFNAVV